MQIVQSDKYKKIDTQEGWEEIRCPICNKEWFARGEYWHCSHLIFTACTYFGFDFNYIKKGYEEGAVVQELHKAANNFQMHLQLNNEIAKKGFDAVILEQLEEMNSPDMSHVLVDPYVPSTEDTQPFITIFGYQE